MPAKIIIIAMAILTTAVTLTWARPPLKEADRAREIAELNLNRDDGQTVYRRVVLLTCRYDTKKGRRVCRSRPVKKEIENVIVDGTAAGVDEISLGVITGPPSEKNMAFLQKDYLEPGRESDQWMYFPAMKKLKRIISQGDGSPKTGSVFGSEIAYEDTEKRHTVSYDYSYQGSESVDNRICDIITAYPTPTHQPKTSYTKEVLRIDRESRICLKKELYGPQGNRVKTFFRKEIVNTDGVWMDKVLVVVNHQSRTMSMEKVVKLAVNIPLDPAIVTHRALDDTAFRESLMKTARARAK